MTSLLQFNRLVGHGDVRINEHATALRFDSIFKKLSIVVALLLLMQWLLELQARPYFSYEITVNISVWSFFVIELITLLLSVNHKLIYLKDNWFLLVIIIVGMPLLFLPQLSDHLITECFRLGLILWLLIPWFSVCLRSLSDNKLGTTLFTVAFIVIVAGILMAGIDPAIHTPIDGIWWAWVTMATVGYGDIVPISTLGKVFASVLILLGLALFAVLTANFSSIFVQIGVKEGLRKINEEQKAIKLILDEIKVIREEESQILDLLQSLDTRLKALEKE